MDYKKVYDNLTIRDIIKFVTWKDIKRAVKYYYPDDKNDYEPVFEYLKTVRKRKQQDPKEQIEISSHNYDCFRWADDPTMWSQCYHIATNRYSMSFRKWSKLCNIKISKNTLESYTLTDILAHFIWEITFYGDEKEMEKTGKELFKTAAEAKKELSKK